MKTVMTIAGVLLALTVIAQPDNNKKSVVIGSMTSRPNALLIVNPQNSDQGVLLPQLSSGQRMSLKPSSPAEDGLIVFDMNEKSYYYWSDGAWVKLRPEINAGETFHSIDPISFQDLKSGDIRHVNSAVFESDNTFITALREGGGEHIVAPVTLPHGAVFKEITLYYLDNDSDNLRAYLIRKSHTGTNDTVISWQSSGNSSSVRAETFSNFYGKETIDLQNYTYRILVVFDIDSGENVDEPSDARQKIYGVRIKYQP